MSRQAKGKLIGNNPPEASRGEGWQTAWKAALLILLTVAVYLPALRAGFIWDDDDHLTQNPCIVGPLGFAGIWTSGAAVYYPLVLTSFWLQHALWGLQPQPYHVFNVAMHGACAVLLWRVLGGLRVPGAWLGAALWALHPVQVESVAWITELKNTQSCLFYLLAILWFLKWRANASDVGLKARAWSYALVVLFATLAILSKASTVMLPVVLGLCWWWMEGHRWRWRNLVWLVPMIFISAAASGWTIWEQKFNSGALGQEWSQSLPERFIISGKVVWFYLGKLIWPHPLMFIYPRWEVHGAGLVSFLPIAAVMGVGLCLFWFRSRETSRAVFFAFAYFCVSLFPVLGFFNVYFFRYSFVGDHFQYLASIGLLALAAAGLSRLPRLMQPVSVVLLLILGGLSWRHAKIFHDSETLWRDTSAKNPSAWIAHDNLGEVLASQGKLDEATQHLERALQVKPDFAEAHNNLGYIFSIQGKFDEAILHYERALQLNPDYVEAHINSGNALAALGKLKKAIERYERALQLNPVNPAHVEAENKLGIALARQGRVPEAIQHFEQALHVNPYYAEAHYNSGIALAQQGKLSEAIEHYERALQLKPDYVEVHNNLGAALADKGKWSEAIAHYKRALELKPDDAGAQHNLGIALAGQGKLSEAIQHLQQALELATAQNNTELAEVIRSRLRSYQSALQQPQNP